MKIKAWLACSLIIFLLSASTLMAQQKLNASIAFNQLSKQEQSLLQAALSLWPKLDAQAQAQLRAQAQHWLKLSAAEQQTLLGKQRQWERLSFTEKSQARARFAAWNSLGTLEQAKIQAAYQQWQKLPLEKQQALKAKFAQQLPEYQQAWILGPRLGKEAQVLQAWLLFIPQAQIKPWLMLLRELNADDRSALIKVGKRWNQQERDTFRTRLLSAPSSARADMIENALIR